MCIVHLWSWGRNCWGVWLYWCYLWPEGSRLKRKWPGWMGRSATSLLASFFRTFVIKNTWRHLLLTCEPPGCMYHAFNTLFSRWHRCWEPNSDGWCKDTPSSGSVNLWKKLEEIFSLFSSLKTNIHPWARLMIAVCNVTLLFREECELTVSMTGDISNLV